MSASQIPCASSLWDGSGTACCNGMMVWLAAARIGTCVGLGGHSAWLPCAAGRPSCSKWLICWCPWIVWLVFLHCCAWCCRSLEPFLLTPWVVPDCAAVALPVKGVIRPMDPVQYCQHTPMHECSVVMPITFNGIHSLVREYGTASCVGNLATCGIIGYHPRHVHLGGWPTKFNGACIQGRLHWACSLWLWPSTPS